MSAMASEGKLTREMQLDALRLATLTSAAIRQHSGHGTDNFSSFRSLLQFYRMVGGNPIRPSIARHLAMQAWRAPC
jgi:hypothetical protein